jgi:hypothetical protein
MARFRIVRVFALAVPIALVAVGGTAMADPLLVEAMGLDVWHVGQLERDLRTANHRDRELDVEMQTVQDRAAVHNLLLDDLVADRISLVEAARRKWKLNESRFVIRDHLARHRVGPTMEAKMAHDLIEMAIVHTDGDRTVALVQRLRAAYRMAYGADLPVR